MKFNLLFVDGGLYQISVKCIIYNDLQISLDV